MSETNTDDFFAQLGRDHIRYYSGEFKLPDPPKKEPKPIIPDTYGDW